MNLSFKFPIRLIAVAVALIYCYGCKSSLTDRPVEKTLFKQLQPEQTGINFSDTLTEGINTNVLLYQYFYNGGGVAVGDLNGDGLEDIYFSANMADNKLYLNKGSMHFTDVTGTADVAGRPGPWKTGVTLVDINGDGKLDIFLSYSGHVRPEKRIPQLFINQGNDAQKVPHFKEMAADYGLSFPSYATQAYFFDYDKDGDLDLLLVNHNPERLNVSDVSTVASLMAKNDNEAGIRLLRNDDGHFTDVTNKSGIVNTTLSYGLAAGISDINNDGLPDIYISNDYNVPDRLYINMGNGRFTDQLKQQIGHTSFYSMGNDIADINNDLLPDIYTLDMLPEDNRRQKLLFGADNYEAFDLNVKSGFHYQYMRNMLQLNNGNSTFSEVGQQMGISNTDWSWAPLFADYDNDGWKDIFITNGYTRDYTNMDFLKFAGDQLMNRKVVREDLLNLVKQIPFSNVKSYFFKNNAGNSFSNVSDSWGITQPSNSNGAAFADLDNDGYMDMVVNNINKPAFIYQNQASVLGKNHYLTIELKGADKNTQGIGAKVYVYCGQKHQYLEQMPTRGYQSSVSPYLHFGLGKESTADSVKIVWQRGKVQVLKNVKANQRIILDEKNAQTAAAPANAVKPIFKQTEPPVKIKYNSAAINDYKRQPLLVNPLSFSGPCMAKADINGDGLEDIYVGADNGTTGAIYIQKANHQFALQPQPGFNSGKGITDASAAFFDADGDGKIDLYVASGGYGDFFPDDARLADRLYMNDGKGNFKLANNRLPHVSGSKGCVKIADVNGDGHPDIFVGGRVIPGRYPETPQSYLLINDGKGTFIDETAKFNAKLSHIGMVTDAAWTDMNGDGKPDLIVVGEWMPITVFTNTGTRLVDATSNYFDKAYRGWWNALTVADFNHDGKPDILAGNLGTNSQCKASDKEPAEMYYKDFDDNGSVDPILCFYIQHKSYPCVTRDELLDQMSKMRPRFPDYKSYADATIHDIFSDEELKSAGHLTANCLETSCFISNKTGRLSKIALPPQAQYSPVYTISCVDLNNDGNISVILCGNVSHERIHFGRYDANYGILLKGDKAGHFTYIDQVHSGFNIKGDVRSVVKINNDYLFGINGTGIVAYKQSRE
ncbi:VCBS repeat-containing protein [Mucilaginibacter sp. KACC 22063]|uniref:VCBS repeat-containing protein n=1 Tax=Mucilaginibacter sp. KACC 22063 TaxID=3025666 RepID=UPI002365B6FF|nr:VCBS repeat-containing protein [Mucilaginibacter sp. KACC 22063]WDF57110.1 VCBS repeat-containing protein [Mucilaginibacter sp. KACC 22063]